MPLDDPEEPEPELVDICDAGKVRGLRRANKREGTHATVTPSVLHELCTCTAKPARQSRVDCGGITHGPVEDVFGTDASTTAGRRSNERDEKLLKMTSRSQLSVIISSQESLKNLSHGVNAAEDEVDVYTKVRSPEESEKRVGAIFDDLDLGLDPTVEVRNHRGFRLHS
ncbi:hypothetical protein M378DRAFT_16811 [Amanita muscaria Koide BX008]|uniref:Uncharacterized protein n=1 Tax=Amanita muscaria (strain Koide BX008) TaxID=946122 RepID=A0A0C2SRV4_AMAMK|nr:hypothetical protein M378DRAFT_16811 [Amanita muscaria Koide BX008]